VGAFGDRLVGAIGSVFGTAVSALQGLAGTVGAAFAQVAGAIGPALSGAVEAVGDFGSQFVGGLNTVFREGLTLLQGFGSQFVGLLAQIGPAVLGALGPMLSQIGSLVASALGGAGSGLAGLVGSVLPAFLDSGGIATRPTLAMIAERRPEAVIPLDQLGRGEAKVTINVTNAAADVATVSEPRVTQGPDGQQIIDLMVGRAVRKSLAGGPLRTDMASMGLAPQPSLR
jgi:hypothetical protein